MIIICKLNYVLSTSCLLNCTESYYELLHPIQFLLLMENMAITRERERKTKFIQTKETLPKRAFFSVDILQLVSNNLNVSVKIIFYKLKASFYSVAPELSHFLLKLSCWCSMVLVMTFSLVSPIYRALQVQLINTRNAIRK